MPSGFFFGEILFYPIVFYFIHLDILCFLAIEIGGRSIACLRRPSSQGPCIILTLYISTGINTTREERACSAYRTHPPTDLDPQAKKKSRSCDMYIQHIYILEVCSIILAAYGLPTTILKMVRGGMKKNE